MNAIQKITYASLVIAGCASGGALSAAESERDFAVGVNAANAKLRGGDVEGALQQYAEIRSFAPESADLSYNMAVAHYRQGDIAAAEPLFQSAAASDNDSLAARARYNLGNCNYASGLELAEKNRPAAIEKLESAITNYRSALEVDSSNVDARANIELAAQLIEQLREEQKPQEQQQDQQQDQRNQEDKEQQSQNQQQQDSQSEQSKKDRQQQNDENRQEQNENQQSKDQQEQTSRSESSEGSEQQNEPQDKESADGQRSEEQQSKDQKEQSKQDQKDSATQNEQPSAAESRGHDAQPEQQQDQNQLPQRAPQDRSPEQKLQDETPSADEAREEKGQQPPRGELTTAGNEEAMDGMDKEPVDAFDPAKDGEMTQQEAEKMLQAIRDRDMLRRYRRQAEEQRQHVPVDRDW